MCQPVIDSNMKIFRESLGRFDGQGDNADMESPSQASVVAIGLSKNV